MACKRDETSQIINFMAGDENGMRTDTCFETARITTILSLSDGREVDRTITMVTTPSDADNCCKEGIMMGEESLTALCQSKNKVEENEGFSLDGSICTRSYDEITTFTLKDGVTQYPMNPTPVPKTEVVEPDDCCSAGGASSNDELLMAC